MLGFAAHEVLCEYAAHWFLVQRREKDCIAAVAFPQLVLAYFTQKAFCMEFFFQERKCHLSKCHVKKLIK